MQYVMKYSRLSLSFFLLVVKVYAYKMCEGESLVEAIIYISVHLMVNALIYFPYQYTTGQNTMA